MTRLPSVSSDKVLNVSSSLLEYFYDQHVLTRRIIVNVASIKKEVSRTATLETIYLLLSVKKLLIRLIGLMCLRWISIHGDK
jgi:hypothetical protein